MKLKHMVPLFLNDRTGIKSRHSNPKFPTLHCVFTMVVV